MATAPTTGVPFPNPGDRFAERYHIEALIGHGGFSRVYSARQEHLGRAVAIKILAPSQANGQRPEVVERRFYREARLISQLQSPNTVVLHDYGRTPDGLLFMVSELVDGRDLKRLVEEEGPLAPDRARRIFVQLVRGLQEAHTRGFLHRDVKPSNIMVYDQIGQRDCVKLLDFGIAKALADDIVGTELTVAGAVVGTPGYMSPEQAMGRPLAPTSDLYCAGLVAYEMLVGHSPFAGLRFDQIRRRLSEGQLRLPGTVAADNDLVAVIERLLSTDPAARPQSAREVLLALGEKVDDEAPPPTATRFAGGGPRLGFPMLLDSTGSTTIDTLGDATTGQTPSVDLPITTERPPSRHTSPTEGPTATPRSKPVIVAAVATLLVLALAAFLLFRGETPEPRAKIDATGAILGARDAMDRSLRNASVEAEIEGKRYQLTTPPQSDNEPGGKGRRPKIQQPRTKNQQPTTKNQEPRTKNQEPRTKNQKPRTKNEEPEKTDFKVRPVDEL